MSTVSELRRLGFDEKRANVYLAILELGEAKAQDIAKKAGISRPTTYDLLSKLSEEGLIYSNDRRGVRFFGAEHPNQLLERAREKERMIERMIPELKSIYNTLHAKPAIRYYEGLEGVKRVFEDTLTAKNKELLGILSMKDLYEVPGKTFMDTYVDRRIKNGYTLKVVRSRPKEIAEAWSTSAKESRELRYAPDEMVFEMTTYLYDNKVGLISTVKENFGMIIESEEYAATMRHLFTALWEASAVR